MILDLAAVSGMVALALSTLNLFGLLRNMFTSGERKLDERVGKVETKLIEHDRRIQTVESEFQHLPKKDDVHRMQVAMTEMQGQLGSMVKTTEATERATRRVEEFLLSMRGKGE